jgi:hypothetical protein
MVSRTRKTNKANKNTLTVPGLRRAFEHIDRFVHTKVLKLSEKEGVAAFRKEWKKVFGQISEQSAKDYLHFMRSTASSASSKKHGQKGGAVTVLAPASIGYDMRGGEGEASVPPYVAGGIAPPMDSQIGEPRYFPPPAADMNSNEVGQKGGRRRKTRRKQKGGALPSVGTALAEFVSRPFGMSSPITSAQDSQMFAKGYNSFPSPRPEINDINFAGRATIYNSTISPVSRMF